MTYFFDLNSDTHNLDHSLTGTTLANLKKQRAQSRTTGSPENGSLLSSQLNSNYPSQSMDISLTSSELQPPSITKFSGVTSDVVSDSTRSRRCCALM